MAPALDGTAALVLLLNHIHSKGTPMSTTRALAAAAAALLLVSGCSLNTATSSAPSSTKTHAPAPTPAPKQTHTPKDGLAWPTTAEFTEAAGGADPNYWVETGRAEAAYTTYDSVTVAGCALRVGSVPTTVFGDAVYPGDHRSSSMNTLAVLNGNVIAKIPGDLETSVIRYGNDPERVAQVDVLELNGTNQDGAYREIMRVLADIDLLIGFHFGCADQDALQVAVGNRNTTLTITTR